MKKIHISLVALLIALATMTVSATAEDSGKQTLTGVVTDTMCGATHMMNDKTAAECTRICVKQGMQYGLLVGKKVYALDGDKTAIDKFAGQRATVTGDVNGSNVKVETIQAAPAKG